MRRRRRFANVLKRHLTKTEPRHYTAPVPEKNIEVGDRVLLTKYALKQGAKWVTITKVDGSYIVYERQHPGEVNSAARRHFSHTREEAAEKISADAVKKLKSLEKQVKVLERTAVRPEEKLPEVS